MLTETFIRDHKLPKAFATIANDFYIPLANKIFSHQKSASIPYFVGINGCQGSGKSTLSEFLQVYLQSEHNLSVVVMSLDDFYFSQADRETLATDIHPLFKTRGVPGTHDTYLIKQALQKLQQQTQSVTIPRFNKATDNPFPTEEWTVIDRQVDVVIFEGWCWGVNGQDESELTMPVNELEAIQDKQLVWRRYVNSILKRDYQPLYEYMNLWVMFEAPSFADVYAWRLEQEQKLVEKLAGKVTSGVMSPAEIKDFIQYYQRLTEHSFKTLPNTCDHLFTLDSSRAIISYQRKGQQ
ncbi:kinase [Paraglaciecola aquimarina]|uniref:Kinase n=1 Tax=Paraglaciecola aquimarina TaxID=1235557 RepID=A0ABU3SZ06_9ALTE|nr:kinase [Paraglaciecola aquimarina]MDU0355152.1 kinase [Paraglaciecola aquimarina]